MYVFRYYSLSEADAVAKWHFQDISCMILHICKSKTKLSFQNPCICLPHTPAKWRAVSMNTPTPRKGQQKIHKWKDFFHCLAAQNSHSTNCKQLPISFYQQQYQKQMAKVKSKFIDNDELGQPLLNYFFL